jgi:hypothetical protein
MDELPKPTFGSSGLALVIFVTLISVYGWQVHRFWVGIGLGLSFLALVLIGNFVGLILLKSFKFGTYFRWLLILIFAIGIGVSEAKVCDQNGNCESLI